MKLNNQRINIYSQRDYVLQNDCSNLVLNMVSVVLNTEYQNEEHGLKFINEIFKLNGKDIDEDIDVATSKMQGYIQSLDDVKYLSEVILYVVDAYWVKHMEEMQDLRQDVKGAIYRNEDPVHVFNKKATELFEKMNYDIKFDILRNILIAI